MQPNNKTQKYNKFQYNAKNQRMVYLDNGMIGWDGENFYRLSMSKKPLGGPIDRRWINQHVWNELDHYNNIQQRR
jgi:hypothetical protein